MSVDIRAMKNDAGDPVLVHVVTGTHDISRHVSVHSGGFARCEDLTAAEIMRKAMRRRSDGRAAMRLLAQHGGPDFVLADGELPDARQVIVEYITEVEDRYVQALNAILGSGGDSGPDIDRWRGHAEACRQIAERLHGAIGIEKPGYQSREWRDSHGVYTEARAREFREMQSADRRRDRMQRAYTGILDKHGRLWQEAADGLWTSKADPDGRFYDVDKIEAAHGPCSWATIGTPVSGEEDDL